MKNIKIEKSVRMGAVAKKILIILGTGVALGLSARPDQYFKILNSAAKEWQDINFRLLKRAIKRLYEAKLINIIDNPDGTTSATLSEGGQKRVLRFNLDKLKLKRPAKWDGLWRMIIFDIPEKYKRARDAFANKLLNLGFKCIQRSVLVYPYDCQDELDFIIEVFELRPFVRIILVKEIDIDLDLRHKFQLD